MKNLIKNEVYKIFRQKKLFVFMGIMLLSMILNYIFFLLSKNIVMDNNSNPFLNMNGQMFPINTLNGVNTIIVIFIIIVSADIITDEYKNGTLKLSLLWPITRTKLLISKVIGLYISIFTLLVFTMTAGYILGTIFWGWGDTLVLSDFNTTGFGQKPVTYSFSPLNGIIYTIGSYILSTIPFISFGMIVIFISLLYSNVGATIATGLGIYFGLGLVDQFIRNSRPFLINTYFTFYMDFAKDIDIKHVILGTLSILIYGIVFYLSSLLIFKKKDILL